MSEHVIEVKEVTKTFKEVTAVNNLSMKVQKGEYLALLGPNGAGKTTLVEMIEGLQEPSQGHISILNTNWAKDPKTLSHALGISLQETRFIDKLTVFETLDLFASFYQTPTSRVKEIIALIRMDEKAGSFVVNLSGGQRQRLALGIALLNKPQILMLDEPTTGLDPNSRRELWDILLDLKKEGNTTMILTTHYMEEASTLCDKIVIMDQGEILAEGSLEELLANNNTGEIIEYSVNMAEKNNSPEFAPEFELLHNHWEPATGKGRLVVKDIVSAIPNVLHELRANYELRSFECRKMTLDDLFVSMTGRKLSD
ncbi:MAG: ATP-binding cassette domain-containing protein [Bacteroidetes bacterium]|jgi:ABC-2 type transport system ATP-binding protein|nr:ATP-binding cassette domain-containing protein [Bacteroidota bacterium]